MAEHSNSNTSHLQIDGTSNNNNIQVSRIMMPDDSNLAGNVHGGTILKLIEEAGVIIATRHCNKRQEMNEDTKVS